MITTHIFSYYFNWRNFFFSWKKKHILTRFFSACKRLSLARQKRPLPENDMGNVEKTYYYQTHSVLPTFNCFLIKWENFYLVKARIHKEECTFQNVSIFLQSQFQIHYSWQHWNQMHSNISYYIVCVRKIQKRSRRAAEERLYCSLLAYLQVSLIKGQQPHHSLPTC